MNPLFETLIVKGVFFEFRFNSSRALLLLKKKKYQEKLLAQADQHLTTIEGLITDIEFAQVQVQVVDSLKKGNEALKQLNALMKLDDVEKILSDAQEYQEYQEEISNLIAGNLTSKDDADVEAEFEKLLKVDFPDIPNHEVPLPEPPAKNNKGITLYNGPGRTGFEKGNLTLTSHRLIWQYGSNKMALPLFAVTSVSQQHSSSVKNATPKLMLKLLSPEQLVNAFKALPALPIWSAPWVVDKGDSRVAVASGLDYIRLGFTQGGLQSFFAALESTLESKLWMVVPKVNSSRVGLSGIERSILVQTVSNDRSIAGAFADLTKLMENAKEMVALSKSLSQRIRNTKASGGEVEEDDTTELRRAMLSMGLEDEGESNDYGAASADAYSFHRQLAGQICRLLLPLLEQRTAEISGGCIDLTTAYCRVNRARGVQLIAPDDLLQAARLMPSLNLPLRLKTFPSGLKVLQLASESEETTLKSTCELCASDNSKGITPGELARKAGIASVLAKERLLLCEQKGMLCRDDSENGLAFYGNLFLNPPLV
nr:vacuolar protein sorting associated protein 36 [Hymenolepis microstoma]